MALSREVYYALEDIVGSENISEEPAVLDGYAFYFGNALWGPSDFSPRPEAAVLPGSTEEVQAIIKVCNRYKIRCNAFSTGWMVITGPNRIQLDLRRMNRILEIDEKNMYAVVEPYVPFAMLHHQTIKKGLRPNVIGAGPNCSVLASHTSMQGMGTTAISSGYSGRNVLGVEWVLPTGEALKLGSLGSGAGWFCGDGPGPSLRGIMRGYSGALSGLGVFTKCAIKLYPWPGPPEHKSTGLSPMYEPEIPENFRVYFVSFPSLDKMYESLYLIGEAEIAYGLNRCPASWLGGMMTASNEDFWELWQKRILQEKYFNGFQLMMAAYSEREMKYKEKCLKEILDRTGGWIPRELMEIPAALHAAYLWTLWGGEVVKALFRPSGSFYEGHYAHDSINSVKHEVAQALGEKQPFVDRGVIMDDGESCWGLLFEQGAMGFHLEHVAMFDPHDRDSLKGMKEFQYSALKNQQRRKTGVFMFGEGMGDGTSRFAGPMCSNYHIWMKKIKRAFDPNTTMDPTGYIRAED